MTARLRARPIERFLGPAAVGGPFAALGLDPASCTPDRIVAALEQQLDRVGQHAEGDTPEADEVRMALHAAAAQLLDPQVRERLLRAMGLQPPEPSPVEVRPTISEPELLPPMPTIPPPSHQPAPDRARRDPEVMRIVATSGGFNALAKRRLAELAVARGVPFETVLAAVRGAAPAPVARSVARAQPEPRQTAAEPKRADPSASADTTLAERRLHIARQRENRAAVRMFAFSAGALLIIAAWAIVMLTRDRKPAKPTDAGATTSAPTADGTPVSAHPETPDGSTPKPPAGSTTARKPSETTAAAPPAPAAPTLPLLDSQALLQSLREACSLLTTDTAKAETALRASLGMFSTGWPQADSATRRAAIGLFVEYIFTAQSRPPAALQAIQLIAAAAEKLPGESPMKPAEVLGAAASIGLLTRLLDERELSTELRRRVDGVLMGSLKVGVPADAGFDGGALAALRQSAARLAMAGDSQTPAVPRALTHWIDAVTAATADPDDRDRVLCEVVEDFMIRHPEPSSDRRVFAAVGELGAAIRWRRGGPARPRLLAWFNDPRISPADLHVLTSAIIGGGAEGIDPAMVLSLSATPSERQRLRDRFATAWGLSEATAKAENAQRWQHAMKMLVAAEAPTGGAIEDLRAALRLSWLSESAGAISGGDYPGAATALAMVDNPPAPGPGLKPRGDGQLFSAAGDADEQWARRWIASLRNVPVRNDLLLEVEDGVSPLGPVTAELIAIEAAGGSPREIRERAIRVVNRRADDPAMVNALLELLSERKDRVDSSMREAIALAARRPQLSTMPDWEAEARRGLVERLLELLAAGQDLADVDNLVKEFADSYERRAGVSPGSLAPSSSEIPLGDGAWQILEGASRIRQDLLTEARRIGPVAIAPWSLPSIERRFLGRLTLASGPVQRFAANQLGACELLAYLACAERPALAPHVRIIMDDLAEQRRHATSIFSQIRLTELAMARLWAARLLEIAA